MSGSDPKARALEAFIDASVTQLLQGSQPQHGLLLLSAWQEAMPALVHLDPVLEPVDSRVFAVLWLWAKQQGRTALAFPSYEYLLARCNIHSKATLARSLALLRLTRWITLCRRVRDQGRVRGNVYALHDEPLGIEATTYLDSDYLAFVEHACGNQHPKVSQVAHTLRNELRVPPATQTSPTSLTVLNDRLDARASICNGNRSRYFGLRPVALQALRPKPSTPKLPRDIEKRATSDPQQGGDHPVQLMNSVQVQNLNSVRSSSSSSSYLYKKTTTTTLDRKNSSDETEAAPVNLHFHTSLSKRECGLARSYLQGFDPETQQALLDELAEKMDVQAKQTCRVRNPLALLSWMCHEVKAGHAVLTSAHLRHRERRERQHALAAHIEAEKARLTAMAKARLGPQGNTE
jgi:hypothetical protein